MKGQAKIVTRLKQVLKGNWVYPAITGVFVAACVAILLLLACFSGMDFANKRSYTDHNWLRMIFGMVMAIAGCVVVSVWRRSRKGEQRDVAWGVKCFSVLLFAAQIIISYNLYFLTDWDPGIVRLFATQIAAGQEVTGWEQNYHALYPNNLMTTLLQTTILRLHTLFPLFEQDYAYMIVIAVNCFVITISCYQLFLLVTKLLNERWALIGYILCVVLAGLSPWMLIPYTDTLGLVFPVLILNTYLTEREGKHAEAKKWAAVLMLSIIGYHIKPQCIIVLIAIVGIYAVRNINKRGLLRLGCILMCLLVLFVSVDAVLSSMAAANHIVLNKEAVTGWTHFLMMGLNTENNGVYSQEDVAISQNIPTAAERRSVNLQIAGERIQAYGFVGLAKHLGKKLLTAFNDGMFAWGTEGTFYKEMFDPPNDTLAPWLRSVLYSYGSNHETYASAIHTLWIGVLLMAALSPLCRLRDTAENGAAIVRLSLLGLILFELVFEVRARYLFTYVPFFVCMAVCGLHGLAGKLESLLRKRFPSLQQVKT